MTNPNIAIKVENLCKCYHIYNKPNDRLKQIFFRGRKKFYREFWALKNVSFEILRGETVGIVGRNGSGKSTLLQVICGIINPTSGYVKVNGRISALLELGSGFNPEFTGKENVYLSASILGLVKSEIDNRYDAILAFAEIGDFIDQPVRTYSSGMLMRLAFSVAINIEPDILIVDEALSVGDEIFQRKCFSRMEQIKRDGATILFVSHSSAQILEFCDRAILINAGEKLGIGPTKQIIGHYQKVISSPINKLSTVCDQIRAIYQSPTGLNIDKETSSNQLYVSQDSFDEYLKPQSTINYESQGAFITNPEILTMAGERVNNLTRGNTYRYVYTVKFERDASYVRFGMLIKTISGLELGGAISSSSLENSIQTVIAGSVIKVEFEFKCLINAGVYFLNSGVTSFSDGLETYLHRQLDIEMFRVMHDKESISFGHINFEFSPKLTPIDPEAQIEKFSSH